MRLFFLSLFFIMIPICHSQALLDKEVTVNFKNINLEKCLSKLEKVSGISFSYNSKQIRHFNKKIEDSFTNKSIKEILDIIFIETSLKYKEIGDQITVYEVKSSKDVVVISGYIRDKESGEELIGARIYFPEFKIGCVSNTYGYYALEVPKGETSFRVNSLGMSTLIEQISIEEEMIMNVDLEQDTLELNAVEVVSNKTKEDKENIVDLAQLDQTIITPNAINKVPAANGEPDLLRHIQQLPGVQPANDGGANFIIRGSNTGGNLVLIDQIPIYHPTHLLGLYSIINTDALKTASLYKDYIPLKYGTRSTSVLQVYTKEGNNNNPHVSGGISGLLARINLEGPIVKKKSSYYFSGRVSTFPGKVLAVTGNSQLGNPNFYDVNGKFNFKINSNNRLYITGYIGRDALQDTTFKYDWGNSAGGIRWNHIINTKTFSNLSIVHSEFSYGFVGFNDFISEAFDQKVITDKINYDFTYFLNNTTKVNYGISTAFLRTGKGDYKEANLFLKRKAMENGIYLSVEKKFNPRLDIKAGIRMPFSFHIGTGDTTSYLNENFEKTQIIYHKDILYDPHIFLDPRAVGTYSLTEKDKLQFAAMVTSQNTHIINYVNSFLPIEIWTPSTAFLKPERNLQVSLGWTHTRKNMSSSVVIYKKHVANVLDYASPIFTSSQDIEGNLLAGNLKVHGIEMMLNFTLTTWYSASLAYAFTKTKQQINGINNNLPYVAPNDRPHYFSFSQYFNLTKKWKITTNYTAHSGTAITLPTGQFIVGGTAFPLYSSKRNAERLPYFSRLDLAFRRQLGVKKKKDHWSISFTITNFLNRQNASVAYVQHDKSNPSILNIRTIDYSPTVLSVNLNFRY